MSNLADILDTKVDDIEKPPLPPMGTYVMAVEKFEQVERGDWKIIEIFFKGVRPTEDVDEDDLKDFGGVESVKLRNAFMFGDDEASNATTKYALRRFIAEHLQVEGAEDGSLGQALANSVNHQCFVTCVHTPSKKNPEDSFANVKSTAPLE